MILLYRIFMLGIPVSDLKPSETYNAKNTLIGIKIKRDVKHRNAILFQEKVEVAYKRMQIAGIATAAGAVSLLTGEPFVMLATIPGALLTRLPLFLRGLEYRGQGVESYIRSLQGETIEQAENSNAWQLSLYDQFEGTPVDKIEAELRKWRGWSKRMAEAFRDVWS